MVMPNLLSWHIELASVWYFGWIAIILEAVSFLVGYANTKQLYKHVLVDIAGNPFNNPLGVQTNLLGFNKT